jgi:hypothetical protein
MSDMNAPCCVKHRYGKWEKIEVKPPNIPELTEGFYQEPAICVVQASYCTVCGIAVVRDVPFVKFKGEGDENV